MLVKQEGKTNIPGTVQQVDTECYEVMNTDQVAGKLHDLSM